MPFDMCSVELKKPMSPVVGLLSLAAVSVISFAILYFGIPGSGFRGLQTGIFFPFEAEFADAIRSQWLLTLLAGLVLVAAFGIALNLLVARKQGA